MPELPDPSAAIDRTPSADPTINPSVQQVLETFYSRNKGAKRIGAAIAPILPYADIEESWDWRTHTAVGTLLIGAACGALALAVHGLMDPIPTPLPPSIKRSVIETPEILPVPTRSTLRPARTPATSPDSFFAGSAEIASSVPSGDTTTILTGPAEFKAQFVSPSNLELSWTPLGPEYRYRLYAAASPTLEDAVAQTLEPIHTPYMPYFPGDRSGVLWLAVKGITPTGQETLFSPATKIRLP